jgi:Scaffold protein Nfu/NifU N terminal
MVSSTVSVQICPAEDVRIYHVRQQLTESSQMWFREHTEGVNGIAELILNIPGVTSVFVFCYSVQISKAKLYRWDEIEPRILQALEPFAA